MDEIKFPVHIYHKIDKQVIKEVINDFGLEKEGSADKLLYDLVFDLNREEDSDEKINKLSIYYQFILDCIKFSDNREVITYKIEFGEEAPLTSFAKIINLLDIDKENFYINKVLNPENLTNDYSLLYRNISLEVNGDSVKNIEMAYGRHVINENFISGTKKREKSDRYEYVWVEIDCINRILRLNISENKKNIIEGKEDGTRMKILDYFMPMLKRKYIFSEDNNYNESYTLFLIYKNLTERIEKSYSEKITNDVKIRIKDLTEVIKSELNISGKEDIGLENRIIKLFERNLIKMDFLNFINKKIVDGRVLNVGFTDSVGGSVKANSGGKKKGANGEQSFDLQDSDVYFDIKETIYLVRKLQSIVISWKNSSIIPDDTRYTDIIIKYSVYNGFYVTHFQRIKVRKEIYNYVLPKFEEYKRRT